MYSEQTLFDYQVINKEILYDIASNLSLSMAETSVEAN